jgi:hypothetical protein
MDRPVAEPIELAPADFLARHFAISPDAQRLAVFETGGADIQLWNLKDLTAPPDTLPQEGAGDILSLALGADDGQVTAVNGTGSLVAGDGTAGWRGDPVEANLPDVTTALADGQGQRWVLETEDGRLHLWQPTIGAIQALAPPAPDIFIVDLALSADGRWLAAAAGPQVWLYDLDAPEADPRLLDGPRDDVLAVALSADGSRLAAGGADGELLFWDLNREQPPQRLPRHDNNVLSLALSADGQRLASGGGLGELKLWDLAAAELEPVPIAGQLASVLDVAITPDGRWLVSAGEDGAVRLWSVPVTELVDLACRTAGRLLSLDELERYLPAGEQFPAACEGG